MTKDPIPEKLIIYDGHCVICNASVHFIEKNDKSNAIHFTNSQSEVVKILRDRYQKSINPEVSVIFFNHGSFYFFSDAAIEIARHLRFPYHLLTAIRILPKSWRDALYRLIANNRYRIFKRREQCILPNQNLKKKLV